MVRWEGLPQFHRLESEISLSIPLWCDGKGDGSVELTANWDAFQFHYGAMGRAKDFCRRAAQQFSFNSTMVRWEGQQVRPSPARFYLLSIPLWCDGKTNTTYNIRYTTPTFNSTMVRWEAFRKHRHSCQAQLSIPLWCDGKLDSRQP